MTKEKDTDPTSLRAAADRLSAIGVQITDIEVRVQESETARMLADSEIQDIKTCYAALCTDVDALHKKVEVLTSVVSAVTFNKPLPKRVEPVRRKANKLELLLVVLAIVFVALAIFRLYLR